MPPARRAFLRAVAAGLPSAVAGCTSRPGVDGRQATPTPAPVPPTETPAPRREVVVALVDYAFEPGTEDPLVVPRWTTVRFVWETSYHNIQVSATPDGSDWSGHERVEEDGFAHEHTFAVPGRYEFWCEPHRSLGMTGTVVVEGTEGSR